MVVSHVLMMLPLFPAVDDWRISGNLFAMGKAVVFMREALFSLPLLCLPEEDIFFEARLFLLSFSSLEAIENV